MKKVFIFILFVKFLSLNGQNYLEYYKLVNQAEILSIRNQFAKSDSVYKLAFTIVKKPFKEDYFLCAINSEKMKNYEMTNKYLIKGIESGLSIRQMRNGLSNFKSTEYWKQIKKNYNKLKDEHVKSVNKKISLEIKEMVKIDQKVRNPIFGSKKKMKIVDEQNYLKLLELINENNRKWIGFSTIGEVTPKGKYDVTDNIVLMLLHFKKEQIENLKPILFEAVMNGEIYPYHFARVIDYKNFLNITNKSHQICQIYGTYFDIKICDCEVAEEKRREIGFEKIADFYFKVNKKYECLK